jgi:predicted transcriptional regulator
MNMTSTSVRIDSHTKHRLEELKIHPNESLNEVIARLIDSYLDTEPLSEGEIRGIEEAIAELKRGQYKTHDQVKRDLGLF